MIGYIYRKKILYQSVKQERKVHFKIVTRSLSGQWVIQRMFVSSSLDYPEFIPSVY